MKQNNVFNNLMVVKRKEHGEKMKQNNVFNNLMVINKKRTQGKCN